MAASKREAKQKLAELLHAEEQGLALDTDPTVADYLQRDATDRTAKILFG